jgi:hypothetical protein
MFSLAEISCAHIPKPNQNEAGDNKIIKKTLHMIKLDTEYF